MRKPLSLVKVPSLRLQSRSDGDLCVKTNTVLRVERVGKRIASLFFALTLAGCANCNFFSQSTGCQAESVAGLILTAPVLLPYYAMKSANDKRADQEEQHLMKVGVDQGDLEASILCLTKCGIEPARLKASANVIAAYPIDVVGTGREQAALMLAHIWTAYSLWDLNPNGYAEHLKLAVQAASTPKMWSLVRARYEVSHIAVNDIYFNQMADQIFTEIVVDRQSRLAQVAGTPQTHFTCDTSGLEEMMALSEQYPAKDFLARKCEWAEQTWIEETAKEHG